MLVVNLVSWAGEDFAHNPGDTIELPDAIAAARIEAGLAAPAPTKKKKPEPAEKDAG